MEVMEVVEEMGAVGAMAAKEDLVRRESEQPTSPEI